MNRLSLASWLQITGPTFVTMVLGCTRLWNAQQAPSGALRELQRSGGRLEGSIRGLDARIGGLDSRIQGLGSRIQGLDVRIDELGDAIEVLAKRLGSS